jgi:hypothetical protein
MHPNSILSRPSGRTSKRGVGNLAACTLDQLALIIRTRLRQMQYRLGLLDAFVTHTGLIANPRSK